MIVAGLIILIKRSVRGATRDLGITVTVYGAMEFAGIILLRNLLLTREFLATQLTPDTPRFAGDMAYGLLQRITQPYFNFVLGAMIVGVALLVVSFVYRENKPVPAQPAK